MRVVVHDLGGMTDGAHTHTLILEVEEKTRKIAELIAEREKLSAIIAQRDDTLELVRNESRLLSKRIADFETERVVKDFCIQKLCEQKLQDLDSLNGEIRKLRDLNAENSALIKNLKRELLLTPSSSESRTFSPNVEVLEEKLALQREQYRVQGDDLIRERALRREAEERATSAEELLQTVLQRNSELQEELRFRDNKSADVAIMGAMLQESLNIVPPPAPERKLPAGDVTQQAPTNQPVPVRTPVSPHQPAPTAPTNQPVPVRTPMPFHSPAPAIGAKIGGRPLIASNAGIERMPASCFELTELECERKITAREEYDAFTNQCSRPGGACAKPRTEASATAGMVGGLTEQSLRTHASVCGVAHSTTATAAPEPLQWKMAASTTRTIPGSPYSAYGTRTATAAGFCSGAAAASSSSSSIGAVGATAQATAKGKDHLPRPAHVHWDLAEDVDEDF